MANVELVAKKFLRFGKPRKLLKKGDRFTASEKEAKIILALGRATKFEPKPEAPGKPETQAGKRRNVTAPAPAPVPAPTPAPTPAPAPASRAVPAMSTVTAQAMTPFAPVPETPAPVPVAPAPAPAPVPKSLKDEVDKVREKIRNVIGNGQAKAPASSVVSAVSRETLTRPKAKTE